MEKWQCWPIQRVSQRWNHIANEVWPKCNLFGRPWVGLKHWPTWPITSWKEPAQDVWSDLNSTHLYHLCKLPHQVVEHLVWCRSAVKVSWHSLCHLWVCRRKPPLCWGFNESSNYILLYKAQNLLLLWGYQTLSRSSHLGKENLQGSHDHPMGEECWVKLSKIDKIVILCYYVSIFYLINFCKIIQNINKNATHKKCVVT